VTVQIKSCLSVSYPLGFLVVSSQNYSLTEGLYLTVI